MTALPGRRRRSVLVGIAAAVAAVVLAIALGILGAVTLYHSTEGADAASDQARVEFPATPTELIAGVDDEGRLASMAVVVAKPSAGGSVIPVPVSADASGGEGESRLPVAETFELEGPETLEREVEILLGVELDEVAVLDADQLAARLAPFGDLEVELPADVMDGSGDVVVRDGTRVLDPADAAAVLTARDSDVPAADQFPAAAAVWSSIAAAAGDGIELAPSESSAVMADAFDGPVGARAIQRLPEDTADNPRGVDISFLDRTDLALVFGQIAPGKMSAPNPALTVRVESPFSEAELAERGMTNLDVAREAVSALLFVRGNVLSVDTHPGDVPQATSVEVADESLLSGVDGVDVLLGPVDVSVGDSRIVGVDAVIRLGTGFLDLLDAGSETADG